METSKQIINSLFSIMDTLKDDNIIQFKTNLILLLENESEINGFNYSHIDKFNENNIKLSFDKKEENTVFIDENRLYDLKSKNKKDRYLACKNILKDFYNQISYFRKYKLITNKNYFSNYILKLAKIFILNSNFNAKYNKYLNDEVTRYIKKHKGNILLKYPVLSLEYDINTYDRKSISNLYNEMKISNENYFGNEKLLDNNKKLYYEIINDSLSYLDINDRKDLVEEFNNYELLKYFNELKDYNNKNKYNNSNVNNLIKYIEEIEGNSSNIYKVIYGKDNNEGISGSNK